MPLDPSRTALLVLDLQTRLVALPLGPHSGPDVVAASARLADHFREHDALVIYVQAHRPNVEQPPGSELVAEATPRPGDLLLTKQSVGTFATTDLNDRLIEHGVETVVICGIATTMAVESTARVASDLGYDVVLPRDAMTGLHADEHEFALSHVLPRFGEVVVADDVRFA
ncbi:cysteine hydrolase family protein [Phytomonospora endophytica]|uniref:Nicotinamidase-related amidase n=1 Tax=Phytomonospora endophytica TaxID=714109 RepID=A0A841FT66_9ACTN|nr:isochorismatase family protein [Phytomonospora endophytica]MBB6035170.1 nicotinamidase-related amidase [Phytomonospora endophytica]GIG64081.1 putative isochorismatase family protein YwoC [Phytomonospora endophytica]